MTVTMNSLGLLDSDAFHGGGDVSGNNNHHDGLGASSDSDDDSAPGWTQKPYNWFYEKLELKRTPSIQDGISYDRERRYRSEGARFILNVGSQMKLRYTTLATGVVYFHRFYMFHSFRVFPRYVTAACCLFLAGKAEETPKKCKDIIKIAKTLLTENQYATFGEDPKEEVLTMERIILQTIRFDLQVEHPYKFLINYAKGFKGNKEKINQILQMAWTFTNDSLSTTICLQWEPEIVAIAMIFLASKIKYEITDWEGRLPSQKHWWDIYVEDLTVEMLEDVCHQVLDLYQKPRNDEPKDSPPMSPLSKRAAPVSQATPPAKRPNTQQQPPPPPPPPIPPPPPLPINSAISLPPLLPPIIYTPVNGANPSAPMPLQQPPPPPPPPPPIPPQISGPWDGPQVAHGTFFNMPGGPPLPPSFPPFTGANNSTSKWNTSSFRPR